MTNNPLLSMEGIDKSFNQVKVLDDVSIEVNEGEIHALLGENGAGKSTLMNILGGVIQPNKGLININGEVVKMTTPKTSQSYGISFIHQELNLVPDLRVYENLYLGAELRNKIGFVNVDEMCQKTNEILDRLGVKVNPKEYIRNLGQSYKQLVEISRALLHNSKLIIMDEPTTALSDTEVELLFELMKNLKKSGISIIYISHKLKEIKEVCDRFTVLRDGKVVAQGDMQDEDLDSITQYMVGKTLTENRLVGELQDHRVRLKVKELSNESLFKNISFELKEGEIAGFTGLAGDGRTELFESLFGYRKDYTGEILVNDQVIRIDHPKKALKSGIGFVPKDRKENAIIKDLSVIHNMSISSLNHFERSGFLQERKEMDRFNHYKDQLNIKVHNPRTTIDKLSGGNQQKVIIARWLELNSDILIFDNPTQGIDIGAKQEIYQHILKLAEQGKSIVILSSEAPEIMKLCHTIYVMYQGEITAKIQGSEATEDTIMGYATGSKKEAVNIG